MAGTEVSKAITTRTMPRSGLSGVPVKPAEKINNLAKNPAGGIGSPARLSKQIDKPIAKSGRLRISPAKSLILSEPVSLANKITPAKAPTAQAA